MYRFFSNPCGKVSYCLSMPQLYLKQNSNQTCFFCKQPHTQHFTPVSSLGNSYFTTYAKSDILVFNVKNKSKKSRKSKQMYTELFEVNKKASNLKKITVKSLNARHFDFITQSDEILPENFLFISNQYCDKCEKDEFPNPEELGNIPINSDLEMTGEYSSEISHDGQNAELLGILDDKEKSLLYSLPISDQETEEKPSPENSKFMENNKRKVLKQPDQPFSKHPISNKTSGQEIVQKPKNTNIKKTDKIKNKMKTQTKYETMKKIEKERSFNQSLLSFVEISVSCQFLNRAFYTVLKYHQNYKNSEKLNNSQKFKVFHPKIFSTIAHGFASKHNLTKTKEVMRIFGETGSTPTAQLFAACFECITRLPRTPLLDSELKYLAKWLKEVGFSYHDLFTKTVFVNDQKEKVLEAVRRLEPGFEINLPLMDFGYSCPLVNHFNSKLDRQNFRSPAENIVTPKTMKKLASEQLKIESNVCVDIKSIERVQETPEILKYRKKLEDLKTLWREEIKKGLKREISMVQLKNNKLNSHYHMNLYPYLRILDVGSYVEIILHEVEKLLEGSETYSNSLNTLFRELGNQVKVRYFIKYKRQTNVLKKQFSLYQAYCDWYLNPDSSSFNTRHKWQTLVSESAKSGPDVLLDEKHWTNPILHAVGRLLYNVIIKDVKIDVNILKDSNQDPQEEPAFYVLFRTHGVHTNQEIKPHPVLSRLIRASHPENLRFDATLVPMVSPPIPWLTIHSGGYILAKANLIRLPQFSSSQWQRLEHTPAQQLYPSLDALNQLASIPWIVNQPVLDVIIHVFNNGGSQKLSIPVPPSACPVPEPASAFASKEERFQAVKQRLVLARKRSEMHSLRCDALYRLSLANHYRNKIFWLPHNMDFRGRVYPVAPLLNHLGSDMARSILYFAKGQPLGPKGLDWLKIHCINLTGMKKRDTISQRLNYANAILSDLLDSADKPLDGKQWWTESENPWQTLACCMTIRDAINSNDPESYVCHFPVHQDGSCNGLQHYAALGRDLAGAISVNLTPADAPQDVYNCVAALVEAERLKDAEQGIEIATILKGFIKRKVIKQTVMTTVYGVTRFGARLQIAKQLKDIEDFPSDSIWQASNYLVSKTFFCLREMFTSTKQIQDWFTECARLISQVAGQPVEWVTPLGLPVIQPYVRTVNKSESSHCISTKLHPHFMIDMFEKPNVMRQKNAFPPNFIHSLDSSHMMLTSLHCEQKQITFVSVHDCFWTHPNTVDVMNKVCREQFVNLHSLPILEDLSAYLVSRYGYTELEKASSKASSDSRLNFNQTLMNVPPKGDLDIKRVLESVYFFS